MQEKRKKKREMNLKRLVLLICLLVLIIQTTTAQSATSLNKTLPNRYGLESTKSYSATEVAELLAIVECEAQKSIDKAYAEGYKAGLLECEPKIARLESLNNYFMEENRRLQMQTQKNTTIPVIASVSCFFIGAALGVSLHR